MFQVGNVCSVCGRIMCSLLGTNVCSWSGISCVQYMEGRCVPRSLCSESRRNYEFHVRNCVLYMEGVCVLDQECGIFFLMEYVYPVRN
jgi:hypothetical protein